MKCEGIPQLKLEGISAVVAIQIFILPRTDMTLTSYS